MKSGLSFLRLITIKHMKMMQILYLDIWSMLLLTGASYKLFKSLLQDAQRQDSSNIVLEENNLPPIIYSIAFFIRSQSINCLIRVSFAFKNGASWRAEAKKLEFCE